MLTSRWNNTNNNRLPLILPSLGDLSQQQPLLPNTTHRPSSTDSTQSIDNAYSLEHLFRAIRRRIRRLVQSYNVSSFYDSLKICARVFRSYASYNLNTIDEFARLLTKSSRDNKKVLAILDQFRFQLSELRHCHSTFEAELLVTTLAIDFHENDREYQQQSLLSSTGKFSPRSRFSKFRAQHIRQAVELKTQLKQTNELLQVLLYDEFNANLVHFWDESEKYVTATIPFHDHHMSYVLRLIPDIALKFEYALQLCSKLFDLETTMLENHPQNNHQNNHMNPTPPMILPLTPRSDQNHHHRHHRHHQQQEQQPQQQKLHQRNQQTTKSKKTSSFFSADITSASSVSSVMKSSNANPTSKLKLSTHQEPINVTNQQQDYLIFPSLFPSDAKSLHNQNDQAKLQLLLDQLEKRSIEEESYRKRLLNCIKQSSNKSEQLKHYPKNHMLALVMTDEPAVAEYQKALVLSDYHIHKSVEDELNVAIRETQHRLDWINTVRARAQQCLNQ